MSRADVRAVLFDARRHADRPARAGRRDLRARRARSTASRCPPGALDDAFRRVLRARAADAPDRRTIARASAPGGATCVRATFRAADQMQRFADFEACFDALFAHYARPDAWRARARRARRARRAAQRAAARSPSPRTSTIACPRSSPASASPRYLDRGAGSRATRGVGEARPALLRAALASGSASTPAEAVVRRRRRPEQDLDGARARRLARDRRRRRLLVSPRFPTHDSSARTRGDPD